MKKYKAKIKRFLCGLVGHRYRKMHTKYKKRTRQYVFVYKCVRCGKIITRKSFGHFRHQRRFAKEIEDELHTH